MQKTNSKLWVRFVPLLVVLGLIMAACGGTGTNPSVSLTVTPTGPNVGDSVTVAATSAGFSGTVTYDFTVTPNVALSESGNSATFTPTTATTYTVNVDATDGTDTVNESVAITVGEGEDTDNGSGGNTGGDDTGGGDTGGGETPGAEPDLTSFGVASSASGPFLNDGPNGITSESDAGVLSISPGDTFYIQAAASDADGIDSITLQLRNVDTEDTPDGNNNVTPLVQDTDVEGFTLGAPTGCTIPTTEETATCVYPVETSASADESNLTDGEYAYVFRAAVNGVEIGGFGNRGYVNTATTP